MFNFFQSKINHNLLGAFQQPFIRYLLVGAGLFFIDLLVFLACNLLVCLNLEISQIIARSAGAFIGFTCHKWFTFRDSNRDGKKLIEQGTGYIAVTVFNIFFSAWLIRFLAFFFPNQLVLSKVFAEIVLVSLTFCLLKLLFFAPRPESHDSN